MKKVAILSIAAVLAATTILIAGCGGSGTSLGNGGGTTTINFQNIALSTAQIDALQPGTTIYAMVDRENGIVFKPVKLGNRYTAGSDDFLTFVDDNRQFGPGDSGSPMLTADGKTIGALSGSFGGNNVLITPIDRMLNTVHRSPASGSQVNNQLVWIASGFSAEDKAKLRQAGYRIPDIDPSRASMAPSGRGGSGWDIGAGKSLAVMYLDGPLLQFFAVGSATHAKTKNELLAFGHRDWWTGQLTHPTPVRPARVVQFVNDPVFGSFKLAVPVGDVEAGLTADRASGVLIDRGATINRLELVIRANGAETTHWVSRIDNAQFGGMSQYFSAGADRIITTMFDSRNLGLFTVEAEITTGGATSVTVLGPYEWTPAYAQGSPGSDAWMAMQPTIDDTSKVVFTVNKL